MLQGQVDELQDRIAVLQAQEELDAIRPDIDGEQIMAVLRDPARADGRARLPLPARAAAGPWAGRRRDGRVRAARLVGRPVGRGFRPPAPDRGRHPAGVTRAYQMPATTRIPAATTTSGTDRPSAGASTAASATAATNATLNSTSYSAKTRPRCSSSTVRWTAASTLTLTAWPPKPSTNAAATTSAARNGSASAARPTPVITSWAGTHRPIPQRRTAAGVTIAPSGTAIASAAKLMLTPRRPPSASDSRWNRPRCSSTTRTVMMPKVTR